MTIEIIFAGLIAFAFGPNDPPGQIGGGGIKDAYVPFDAYLVAGHDHIAEMLVRHTGLTGDWESIAGACARSKIPSPGRCATADLRKFGDCDADHPWAVFCLADTRVEFDQSSGDQPRYQAGGRRRGSSGRYFDRKKPGGGQSLRQDVSWIAEMSKAAGTGTIRADPESKSLAKVEGLRGTLTTHGISANSQEQATWKWCTWDGSTCDPSTPPGLGDYEQMLGEAMHMDLGVDTPVITLVTPMSDAGGTRRQIRLDPAKLGPVRIVNWPPAGTTITQKGGLCIADHFEVFYELLAAPPASVRVPYTLERGGNCPPPRPGTMPLVNVLDSFCPPTILKKP